LAADHGVRVFTVGFGTAEGTLIRAEGWSVYVRLDEETLKSVADITRGAYFHAGTAQDLRKVYHDLNARFALEKKDIEVTFVWTAAAAVLLLASLLLSLLWFNRVL
jgi:Ca-activated chloride channel family protein